MRSILLFYFVALAAPADEFTAKYCETCHNPEAKMGGLSLRGVASYSPVEIWEKVAKRIRAGEMPPAGAPRPEAAALAAYVARIHNTLDSAPAYAGRPVVRRLNRTEYKNAIRDLLALDLPLTGDLPQDPFAAGFDTIADALSMSPLLLERYLKVARRVSELAMGTGDATPVVEIFPAKDTQAAWQGEGMPIGTRGGIRVTHYFPRDGDYDLRAFLVKESLTPAEGVRFFRTRVSKVKAGNHTVIVTFPDEFAEREGPVSNVSGIGGAALGGPLDVLGSAVRPSIDFRVDGKRVKRFEIFGMNAGEAAFDGQPGPPALARIEIAGPYNAASGTESVSRQRILTCRDHTPACVEQILRPLVRRAFRRDVNDDDLRPFLAAARGAADLDSGISAALREILLSPDFLFRLEFDPPGARPDDPREVTPFEFASRLSFFLWSTIPDDALLNAAAAGRVDEGEVRRMLADPKAGALIDNFAAQWLGLPALQEAEPDRQLFPVFDKGLASAFASETRLVVTSLIRENRKLTELIDGGYTYLNDRLAAHYGIPG
ncbi:MAG: DUF1592 domain-containing protein, partial [Acidobacteria bacterium]|nr:DUF1592 domain-containing protein [Acidobacteriota bacterium]